MIDSSMIDPATPALDPAKPYAAPHLSDLGTVGAVTAGPDTGTLDQLGGATGGFIVAQGTS